MTWGGQRQARDLRVDRLMNTNPTNQVSESVPLESSQKRARVIKLGLDVHGTHQVVVRQIDQAAPQPAQRFTPAQFLVFARKQLALAEAVHSCYEAGPFGYVLHRQLTALGVRNLVVRPRDWSTYGERVKTDSRDAAALCSCLDRHLAGNRGALAVVWVPNEVQEQARAVGRQRQGLQRTRVRLILQGKSAALLCGEHLPKDWWAAQGFAELAATLPVALAAQLERWQRILLSVDAELAALTTQLEQSQAGPRPLGVGALTLELLTREVGDWGRFRNRRQVASYTGLCPSERSSGQTRRQGAITRHGNPRLRHLLIEAVWRLLKFQPDYRAIVKWRDALLDAHLSRSRKKKIIVALARQLAVDLWRLATGRARAEALGLQLSP
jgi:transposase